MKSICLIVLSFGIALLHLKAVSGDDPALNHSFNVQPHSISGCMATSCHGSNVSNAKTWQRAGKIWFDSDPHAQAYARLLTERSARIVSRLANEELKINSKSYRDLLNAKCVSCHANESTAESLRVLGIDCQVCHGDADAWGSSHYSAEWKALGQRRFDDTQMINVESLTSRAKVCSSCHIGEINRTKGQRVGSDREVDHRLMAAGHPPMHFDFESYLRRYPVHWDQKDEPVGQGSSMGFERWRIGKIAAAVARIQLLAARAERSSLANSMDFDWPEFTEYSCTSCHHSLEQPSWRQVRGLRSTLEWDDWCLSELDRAVRNQSQAGLKSQIDALKQQVEQLPPDVRRVALTATALKKWLELELGAVSASTENSVEIMLSKLNSCAEIDDCRGSWESATQWYIATRVLSEGVGIVGGQGTVPFVAEDPFLDIEKTWKGTPKEQFDTPRPFRPEMLNDYKNHLMQQLRKRP